MALCAGSASGQVPPRSSTLNVGPRGAVPAERLFQPSLCRAQGHAPWVSTEERTGKENPLASAIEIFHLMGQEEQPEQYLGIWVCSDASRDVSTRLLGTGSVICTSFAL